MGRHAAGGTGCPWLPAEAKGPGPSAAHPWKGGLSVPLACSAAVSQFVSHLKCASDSCAPQSPNPFELQLADANQLASPTAQRLQLGLMGFAAGALLGAAGWNFS